LNSKSDQELNKALFIVCPFCHTEEFLRVKFGKDIFFSTFPGAVLNHKTEDELLLNELINREGISEIFIVNDISCNFIENAIDGKKEFGLKCETHLKELNSKLSDEFKLLSLKEKKEIMAKTNVLEQLCYLKTLKNLKQKLDDNKINLHAMVTDKNFGFEIVK
jgi:hypothetical protein